MRFIYNILKVNAPIPSQVAHGAEIFNRLYQCEQRELKHIADLEELNGPVIDALKNWTRKEIQRALRQYEAF